MAVVVKRSRGASRLISRISNAGDVPPNPHAPVQDEETLYRRVLNGQDYYQCDIATGEYRVTSSAFSDRHHWQPSVDRACLCGFNPRHTQQNPENFVARLLCKQVRAINFNRANSGGVDVHPAPEEGNFAHTLIIVQPDWDQLTEDKAYKRFKQALARLAQWEIGPLPLA